MSTDTRPARWQFWIDRGGTFTDIVGKRPDGRARHPQAAVREPGAVPRRRGRRHPPAARPRRRRADPARPGRGVKMGTTVATNALLERKGEPTLLVITRGFRDALRIGYQDRPRIFDRTSCCPSCSTRGWSRPTSGSAPTATVVRPLDEAALRRRAEGGARRRPARAWPSSSCTAGASPPTSSPPSGWRARPASRRSAVARGQPADEAGGPRRHDGRRRLPVADPAPLRRHRWPPRCRACSCSSCSPPAGSPTRRRSRARTRSCPGRPAASSAWCGPPSRVWRRAERCDQRHRLRHGRHLHRRQPLRRRVRARLRDPGRRRADARADDGDPHRGGRRRLDPGLRRRALPGRAAQRRRQPGPGLLPPRRAAHGDRRQRRVGKIQPGVLPARVRPARRPAARRARSCAAASPRSPQRSSGPPARRARRSRSPRASSTSRSATWPTRSRRSRSRAATTSPATPCSASAAPAASTPAASPMRSACRGCSSTRSPACSRPTAWAWRTGRDARGGDRAAAGIGRRYSPRSGSTRSPPRPAPSSSARACRRRRSRSIGGCMCATRAPIRRSWCPSPTMPPPCAPRSRRRTGSASPSS